MRTHRIIFILIIFVIILSPVQPIAGDSRIMNVHFINVGQGDSILIQTPEGKHILIDGGPPASDDRLVQYLKDHKVEKIDLMIATHPDIDHIGGLKAILKSFPVKKVMDLGKVHPTKTFMSYVYQLFKRKVPISIAQEGETINLFNTIDIKILNAYNSGEDNNEASIAMQLSYEDVDFLLMGDVGKNEEKKLLENDDLQADIIKIGHHGSKTSTSLPFLEAINPKVALITYSKNNKYGHPVDRVIRNLHTVNAQIFSTAVYGNIIIETDGKRYIVLPEKSPMDGLESSG